MNKSTLKKAWAWTRIHWKVILKTSGRVALVAIGICALIVGDAIGHEIWDDHYGPRGSRVISRQHKIHVHYFADMTDRLKDHKTGKWTSPKLRWVGNEPPVDSISVFCDLKGNRGFYNTHTGRITIDGRYRHAWYFSDGVAAVVGADDKWVQFIDHEGNQAVPGRYHYSQGYDYVFHDGLCEMYNDSTGMTGLLRKDGTWAFEQVYDYISDEYVDGWRITSKGSDWQFWKADLTLAFPESYDHISMADDGKGVFATKDHVKMLLDYDGKVLEPFIIDGTYPLHYMTKYHDDDCDEYELVPEVVAYRVDSWQGLMDKRTGRILTPPDYHDLTMVSRTLVRAQYEYWDDESVILDLKGNIVKLP